jgi:hypothetical protein
MPVPKVLYITMDKTAIGKILNHIVVKGDSMNRRGAIAPDQISTPLATRKPPGWLSRWLL